MELHHWLSNDVPNTIKQHTTALEVGQSAHLMRLILQYRYYFFLRGFLSFILQKKWQDLESPYWTKCGPPHPPTYLFVKILLRNVDGKGITGLYYANSICTCRSVKPLHTHTHTHYVHTYKKCVAETLKDDHSKNEQTTHSTPKTRACMPSLSLPVIRKVIKQTYMVIRSFQLKR